MILAEFSTNWWQISILVIACFSVTMLFSDKIKEIFRKL
jgi:hypothetical protein